MGNVLQKLLRWFVYAAAVSVMLLALLVGIARLFLPLVPEYQDDIRRWAAAATGFDVQFNSISASWPFAGPQLRFIDVTVLSQETGEEVFVAENLTVGISLLELVRDRKALLNRLGIEGSNISVQRDINKKIIFQGRPLEEFIQLKSDPDKSLRLPDVLIELSEINVSVSDDLYSGDAYEFVVGQLDIQLSSDQIMIDGELELAPEFGGHATISTDIPTRLLQSQSHASENVNRRSVGLAASKWRLFFDGEDLRLGNILTTVLNREVPVTGANGAVLISADFLGREPQNISVELDVEDVGLRIDANRTERHEVLSGRLEWARNGEDGWLLAGTDISVERLDLFSERSDFSVAVRPTVLGRNRGIKASARFLRLHDLYPFVQVAARENLLATTMPEKFELPQAIYGDVQNFDLNLSDSDDESLVFSLAAQFIDIGIIDLGGGNSIRGISGGLTANQDGGRVQIVGQAAEVTLPAIFIAPIEMQSVTGILDWRVSENVIRVLSDNIRLRSPFVEGDARIELDWPRNGDSPRIDLTATGFASEARRVVPLLPLKKLPAPVTSWLDRAIISGQVTQADIRFSGPLREFPFDTGEGVFNIGFNLENGVLDYAQGWPRIDNIDAHVVFDGVSVTVQRNSGRVGLIRFRDADVQIADLRQGLLEISAQQSVPVKAAINFLRRSPVATAIGPVIGKVTGSGNVNADLQLTVPVMHPEDYELEIAIDANGANLGMTGIDWGLTDLNGALTVRNTRFYSDGMTAMLLGEPVKMDMRAATESSDLYGQFIRIEGRTPVERWMQALSMPFVGQVNGPADWVALVLIPQQLSDEQAPVHIIARSDLIGVQSRLPDPLAKTSVQARALEVDVAFPAEGQLEVAGQLRPELTWAFELESSDETWRIARGAVHAGSAAAIVPTERGVELSGHLEFLHFDDWLALTDDEPEAELNEDLSRVGLVEPDWQDTWREAVFAIDRLAAFGQLFSDVQLEAYQDEQNWQIVLEGEAIAGQITAPLDLDSGRPIKLDMERFWLVDTDTGPDPGNQNDVESADPRSVPSFDIEVDDFVINDMHFGSLSTTINNVAGGILIEPIKMQAETFTIDGDAAWLVHPNDDKLRQASLSLSLNGSDIEAVLVALGYDPVITGESIHASGDLTWLGGPRSDFLQRADGTFTMSLKDGSLLDVDPGGGRILGVLSVAALPRRLLFDFSDVFDDGLNFDSIKGDFTVDDGNAYTCNLGMEGSVADMGIVGRAGFEARDYDQLAVVRPHVSNLLAVGGTVVAVP